MVNDKYNDYFIEYFARKIRNPIKRNVFFRFINSDNLKIRGFESRLEAFFRVWNNALSIARSEYGFNNKTGKILSRIAADLFAEDVNYKSSKVSLLDKVEGKTIKQKIKNAEVIEYINRTEAFFNKYGDDKTNYNDKTLNECLEEYKNGLISKDKLNKIIKDYQKSNPEYNPSIYRKHNSESRDISNYFD